MEMLRCIRQTSPLLSRLARITISTLATAIEIQAIAIQLNKNNLVSSASAKITELSSGWLNTTPQAIASTPENAVAAERRP